METPNSTALEQALRRVEDAKKEAEAIRKREFSSVVAEVKAKIALYGITAEDLGFAEVASKKDSRSDVKPKYRDEKGNEWSGRGKYPAWVKAYIDTGGNLTDLLIEKEHNPG